MIILSKGTVILDHYKIEELKTAAGQCFGYNAIDIKAPSSKPWERSVFVKQYHDIMPGSDESHSLLRKYDALRDRLGEKSNYICLPQSSGEAGGALVTVFPFVNGKSLKDKFMDGLTQEECIRISFALIKTVREIHKKGIAHLDLKHDNVVIEESARDGQLYIRLIDFDAASIDGTCLRSSVKGTEHYFSPEHAFPERFGEVSSASDIFTLGIMLSELLLRRHPFAEAHDYRAAITSEDYQIPENEYHREVHLFNVVWMYKHGDRSDALYNRMVGLIGGK